MRIFEEVEKMRKTLVGLLLALASCAVPITLVRAAEEPKPPATEQKPAEPAEKPLEPGWLSLDSTVGVADNWIALNKSALQDAIGINISGFLDSAYNWSSNHPGNPRNISGRIFNKDYNQIQFNNFNLTLDKPEKDWCVVEGKHIVGDQLACGGAVSRVVRVVHHDDHSFRRGHSIQGWFVRYPVGRGNHFAAWLLQLQHHQFVQLFLWYSFSPPGRSFYLSGSQDA